jgi:sugar lactone lactonase YvrE
MNFKLPTAHITSGLRSRFSLWAAIVVAISSQAVGQQLMTITFAGKAGQRGWTAGDIANSRLDSVMAMARDRGGSIYFVEAGPQIVQKISPDDSLATIAGSPYTSGSADGVGRDARFNSPQGIAVATDGTVYVADTGNATIRKITPDGTVTTFAGAAGQQGDFGGQGANARFRFPTSVVIDSNGNLFVVDSVNYKILKITSGGFVSTFAGSSFSNGSMGEPLDGVGTAARFGYPNAIAIDANDNLYVSDSGWSLIRKITPGGVVTTIAGQKAVTAVTDGPFGVGTFYYPTGLDVEQDGSVIVTEKYAQVIRRVAPSGELTTVAGSVNDVGGVDGTDANVRFNHPNAILVEPSGNWVISDQWSYTLRRRMPVYAPVFTTQPQSVSTVQGSATTLNVIATGIPAPTYQWMKDGVAIAGATTDELALSALTAGDSGTYTVAVTNIAGTTVSAGAAVTVITPPAFVSSPVAQTVRTGASAHFAAIVSSLATTTYQWQKNGVTIPGATDATYDIASVNPEDAGTYTIIATNVAGAVVSNAAQLSVQWSRFSNLSVRAAVGIGDSTLIVGFVLADGAKQILARGVGPGLAPFHVPNPAPDPFLQVLRGSTVINSNDNWSAHGNDVLVSPVASRLEAFELPVDSRDAALVATFAPNLYTMNIGEVTEASGTVLAELYDTNVQGAGRLVNVSARAHVDAANPLIAGLVIAGNVKKRVLIRAAGPALTGFGVSNTLPDPQFSVYQNGAAIFHNDDWAGTTEVSQASASVQAFPFASTSKDAAAVLDLDPGLYSVVISASTGTVTGNAMVEVYELP